MIVCFRKTFVSSGLFVRFAELEQQFRSRSRIVPARIFVLGSSRKLKLSGRRRTPPNPTPNPEISRTGNAAAPIPDADEDPALRSPNLSAPPYHLFSVDLDVWRSLDASSAFSGGHPRPSQQNVSKHFGSSPQQANDASW